MGEALHRLGSRIRFPNPAMLLPSSSVPERLVIAPKDLHSVDAGLARDIYSGRFFLAGKLVETNGDDPFSFQDAPLAWQRSLHSFVWLRHIDSENTALATMNAVALISDWCNHKFPTYDPVVWDYKTAAQRLIAWLCHSVLVVEVMTPRQYQSWMKSIGRHIRFLKKNASGFPDDVSRLYGRIALAYAGICCAGVKRTLASSMELLDEELERQIADDGVHVSRNPAIHLELLLLLLPLRQAHASQASNPSQSLISAIDRLMLATKFLRLGDGNLARFNGTSLARSDDISTALQYDDSPGNVTETSMIGGYMRLQAGQTLLLADLGLPAASASSTQAHAGTLSFEMSCQNIPILVNCGAPSQAAPDSLKRAARASAAHNTLIIENTSSSRIYSGRWFKALLADRLVRRPKSVFAEKKMESDSIGFSASHNGYLPQFGIVHRRDLRIALDGQGIIACDRLGDGSGKPVLANRDRDFAIRFHLHPAVSAGMAENGDMLLMCGSGISWRFAAVGAMPVLEESIYFASASGPRRTRQIVLYGQAAKTPEIVWQLTRENLESSKSDNAGSR